MPRVLNTYKLQKGETGVYVGRPSLWRNIYRMTEPSKRDEVCDLHILFVLGRPGLMQSIRLQLKGKNLICFCAPKRCHGDFLLRLANEPHDALCIARDLIFYPGRTTPVVMEVFEVFEKWMATHEDHYQDYLKQRSNHEVPDQTRSPEVSAARLAADQP